MNKLIFSLVLAFAPDGHLKFPHLWPPKLLQV